MPDAVVDRSARTLQRISRGSGIGVAVLGALVLLGWGTDATVLKSVVPGQVAMKPNTALGFVLAGIALQLLTRDRRRIGGVLACVVALLGAASLLQDLRSLDLGIDEWLFRDERGDPNTGPPGRMSPLSAIAFILSGTSLGLVALGSRSVLLGQLAALAAGSLGLVVGVGYLLSVDVFVALPFYTNMAVHTSVGFVALAAGALGLRPDEGFVAALLGRSKGGQLASSLLPVAIGLPAVVSVSVFAAERIQLVGLALALTVGTLVTSLVLAALVIWAAQAVDERERLLDRQRHWFATTLASIGDGVIVTDLHEKIRFLNAEAQRLTGWTTKEATNLPLSQVFHIVAETDRRPIELPTRKVLRENAVDTPDGHTLLRSRGGDEYAIEESAAPIRSDTEGLLGVILVFRDVSERRVHQRELEKSRALLATRARDLELQDQRKDEFLAVLGHELRNPLAAIASGVPLIEDGAEDLDWVRAMMERQIGQLSSLLDDLLDLTRVSRGKIRLRREVHDLGAIVREVADSVDSQLEDGGKRLDLDLGEEGLCTASVDRTRIGQVVSNLLVNAIKFSGAGARIGLTLRRDAGWISLDVRDEGIGMSTDVLERCFEPFAQGKPGGGGLGIGLALVRQLVELHGGSVSAQSEGPGRGSVFRVLLPVRECVRDDVGETSEPAALAPLDGLRVLVVDDNVDAALGLAQRLRRVGCHVETAFSGEEGLEAARRRRPDVALLDLGLPGMHGGEVARALRDDATLRDVLIVAVTGQGQDQARRLVREEDFDARLLKPVDFDALCGLLRQQEKREGDSDGRQAGGVPASSAGSPRPIRSTKFPA